jgi:hypothetical protein
MSARVRVRTSLRLHTCDAVSLVHDLSGHLYPRTLKGPQISAEGALRAFLRLGTSQYQGSRKTFSLKQCSRNGPKQGLVTGKLTGHTQRQPAMFIATATGRSSRQNLLWPVAQGSCTSHPGWGGLPVQRRTRPHSSGTRHLGSAHRPGR